MRIHFFSEKGVITTEPQAWACKHVLNARKTSYNAVTITIRKSNHVSN